MAAAILYDTVRLFLRSAAMAPRGVDRVDLAFARFFLETWPADCWGTLPTPWGVRLFERARVLRGLAAIEEYWGEVRKADEDQALARVKQAFAGIAAPPADARAANNRAADSPLRWLGLLGRTGFAFGRSAPRSAPAGALYLNVGQLGLAFPFLVSWLGRRPDIRPVFMLHDVIPLEHPEFVTAGARRHHGWMVDAAARHAAGLIVTTDAARASIMQELRARGRDAIPALALPLPVAPAFLAPPPHDPRLAAYDYFVVCGAIEPRKNHALLIELWRQLGARYGDRRPKLVIAGSPVARAVAIVNMLEEAAARDRSIVLMRGLSSAALHRLLANARGLLMPSFAEGFGLPVAEALASGAPVIASDLPAHREVGGDAVIYRSPGDPAAWLEAVERLMEGGDDIAALKRRIAAYRPMTADAYFREIARFVAAIAAG